MAVLQWHQAHDKRFETGTKMGVLYLKGQTDAFDDAYAWNGLTAVTESPSGAEETPLYADDEKYVSLRSAEEFGGTIECYTYPDAWMRCDGSLALADGVTIGQQKRETFGFCYRTVVGDELDPEAGYKLHLVYNATASPSERAYQTVNDSPEAITFSYEFTTTPVPVSQKKVPGAKATSVITVDSTKISQADKAKLTALENILYGTAETDAKLPTPDEVYDIFNGSGSNSGNGEG